MRAEHDPLDIVGVKAGNDVYGIEQRAVIALELDILLVYLRPEAGELLLQPRRASLVPVAARHAGAEVHLPLDIGVCTVGIKRRDDHLHGDCLFPALVSRLGIAA